MGFPVQTVIQPAVLAGKKNGRLPETILVEVPCLFGGPTVRLLTPAARAWRALRAAALTAGHSLKAVSATDSYRPFDVQERIFRDRYTTTRVPGMRAREWQGQLWFKRDPDLANAAVPGTSNHGRGLAVDTGEERDQDSGVESLDQATLRWLLDNELRFGFSHEDQTEPWHIRYFAGDTLPAAVQDFTGEDEDMALGEDIYRLLHDGRRPPGTAQTAGGGVPIAWIVRQMTEIKNEQTKARLRDEAILTAVRGADDGAQILAAIDQSAAKQIAAVKALRVDLARELADDFLDALNGQVDNTTAELLREAMDTAVRQVTGGAEG